MTKKKKGRGLTLLIVVLCVALAAVVALIIYKQNEYRVSTDYYNSLRVGAAAWRRLCA